MLYSIKNRDDLEILNELISLQNQVKALRLQYKLVKQNFLEDLKKLFEPITKLIKDTSQNVTKTMMEISKENNNALSNLNDKLLEIMNDTGILASYLLSSLSKFTSPEHTIHFTEN